MDYREMAREYLSWVFDKDTADWFYTVRLLAMSDDQAENFWIDLQTAKGAL